LVLPGAVFRQEAVGGEPSRAQRRHIRYAETVLPTPSDEGVSRAGPLLDPGIREFLLEGGEQRQPRLLFERVDGPAQEMPRAAFPMRLVGVQEVAEIEPLRDALIEFDL